MVRQIKVYGERNTNTNYLEQLLRLNLDVVQLPGVVPRYVKTIQKVLPGKEWLRDWYFSVTQHRNLGWKHSCVQSVSEPGRFDILSRDICFVSITKNPYSWLMSLYRKPYSHQYGGEKPDFETFLATPWKTVARDNCESVLANPVELWNIKNASYLQLTDFNGLNLTTESTVDSSKDFAWYQDFYLNEKWRNDLSERAAAIISESVDQNLMNHFGYKILDG